MIKAGGDMGYQEYTVWFNAHDACSLRMPLKMGDM